MPLDPYSLCPGGRDKKIRFCCPDKVKEIEQIERLLESKQSGACLSFIESLEKDHPDCACMTAAKLTVYRMEDRWEDALNLSKEFLAKEPKNPVAAAEYALALGVTGQLKEAISQIVDAFERSKEGTAHSSLINTTLQIGACMLMRGFVMPVVAIGNRLKMFPMAQEQANSLLYQASSIVEIPMLLRDMMFDQYCPDDFPGKTEFEDAIELLSLMQWKQGLSKLESLTQYADHWPNIWRNVAAVNLWLLEDEKGLAALEKFASLPNTPLEDAVDAEASRLFLTTDALGDQKNLLFVEYKINDAEKILEKMLSTPLFYRIDFDPKAFNQRGTPPPKGVFILLDRPFVEAGTELNIDNVSSQLASCMIFGKETDRDARLEVMEMLEDDKEKIENILRETFGDLIIAEAAKTETLRPVSQSQILVQYRFRYTPETMPSSETRQKLEKDYYEKIFLNVWSNLPLGLLDGKTANEAAKDPRYKIRILAAIEMLEYWMNEETGIVVANQLRQKLGLPILNTIPIPKGNEEEQMAVLDDLPVWRWYRLDVEKLPTSALIEGIQIVAVMKEPRATLRFANEILNRPMSDTPIQARMLAFESLIGIARGNSNLDDALLWIEKAKNEAVELKTSDAVWCLHEIPIRLGLGQLEKAHEAINDIVKRHGHDQRIMQSLHQLFVQLGFLNPDGTPSAATRRGDQMVGETSLSDADSETSTSGGIWTPGNDTPSESGTGSSKLWTPD